MQGTFRQDGTTPQVRVATAANCAPVLQRALVATVLCLVALCSPRGDATEVMRVDAATPQAAVDSLLAADRAFSAMSAKTDLVSGLSAMFDADIVMPIPAAKFARGRAQAVEALRVNPDNPTSRAEWTPIRGGVSADGRHGFTFGYMTIQPAGKPPLPAKYLAYWIRRPEGWRVLAYKRAPRPGGEVSLALLAPSLPLRLVPVATDQAHLVAQRKSLSDAERAFSDEAQSIGIGPAFAKHGRDDAMNMGAEAAFLLGAANIGGPAAPGETDSPVSWASDDVAVASSGDLGVSWGVIRPNEAVAGGQRPATAFFTIWRRDGPAQPWRYIAE